MNAGGGCGDQTGGAEGKHARQPVTAQLRPYPQCQRQLHAQQQRHQRRHVTLGRRGAHGYGIGREDQSSGERTAGSDSGEARGGIE